jgi:zinc transport system substrate-binding protein
MRKKIVFFITLILISSLSFGGIFNFGKKSKSNENEKKIKIVTTLFPVYEFTKQITGDRGEVTLLLKPGSEAHSFDPTPRDMMTISKAKMFIYTSEAMEPWVEKIEHSINSKKTMFVESGEGVTGDHDEDHRELEMHDDEHDEEDMHDDHEMGEDHNGHEHHDHEIDPHIWTDPLLAVEMVENILDALINMDSENTDYYESRAEKYINQLIELDMELESKLSKINSRTIVTGGHFAMAYFAERYNLDYISAYDSFAPNAEPKPKDVAKLRNFIKENSIKYIYYEELINPKIAKVLANESGVKLLLLHGAHNVSKQELENNITYIEIMKNNLKNLELGLNTNE